MLARRALSTARTLRSPPALEQVTARPTPVGPSTPAVRVTQPAPPPPPPPPAPAPAQVRVKRSIGGFRGGITGFLLGAVVAGAIGYSYLLQDYSNASTILLTSVDELTKSTGTLTQYVKRIEALERSLSKIESGAVKEADLSGLRREMHRVYGTLNVGQLDLKSKIVALETELAKVDRARA